MYLDTDVILAFVKEEDWLKKHISLNNISNPKTSTFTIIEAEIVLDREYERGVALQILPKIQNRDIHLLPLTEKIVSTGRDMLAKYAKLNVFDAIHVAFSFSFEEILISTDTIFNRVKEVQNKDPRRL